MSPPFKGIAVILILCCLVALFTYLSMTLIPGIKKSEEKAKEPKYYRAAILEVAPFSDNSLSIEENIEKNLKTFELAVEIANTSGVDIIVFPESVLYVSARNYLRNRRDLIGSIGQNVPDPKLEDYIPCEQEYKFRKNKLLIKLSCLAKKGGMYLVANIVDYKGCNNVCGVTDDDASSNCVSDEECPEDGIYLYNTNVVFNREGKLIARYHKKHLYFEPIPDPSKCPESGYFETEFGTFSTFICFDMMFEEAQNVVEQTNVDNVAYPYHWFDHTPLIFFANVFQQGFASYNKINVLAANSHQPERGTIGSGIFSGSNGALIYTHIADGTSKLLISNVPKHPKEEREINFDELNRQRFVIVNNTFYEDNIEEKARFYNTCTLLDNRPVKEVKNYNCYSNLLSNYEFVKLEHPIGTVEVCSKSFCCSVSYKSKSMTEDYFAAASAMAGNMNESFVFDIQSCFITRCKSNDGKSCSSFLLNSKTVFQTVDIKGNFSSKYVYPIIVDSNLRLTKKEKWDFDRKSHIQYQNEKDNSSLLFLGIYGREFD